LRISFVKIRFCLNLVLFCYREGEANELTENNNDIEMKVQLLEHDFSILKENITASIERLSKEVDEIKDVLSSVEKKIIEIDKKLEAKTERYNGYIDVFVTKKEFYELKNEVIALRAERDSGRNTLVYWNVLLTVILTILMIMRYLKDLHSL